MSNDTSQPLLLITGAEAAKLAAACRTIASIFKTASEYVPVPGGLPVRDSQHVRDVQPEVLSKPKKPNKPLKAEALYNRKHRIKLRIAFPDKDKKEITEMLADQWAQASDDVREEVFAEERALQTQYDRDLAVYEIRLREYEAPVRVNEPTYIVNERTSPVNEGRNSYVDTEASDDGGNEYSSKAAKPKKKKRRKSSYDDVGLDLGLELGGSLKKKKKKRSKSKDGTRRSRDRSY
ncbi:hypothetical protein GGI19_000374 [Coemansia pectinata]|uniref:HMG box domain-containing protein n=1 Tax=Coemansia pectinata TaxID=1052879 RepID=A0A9W8GZI4_9FUNG|nr:hypothetical protein GGI19_000374 [Coemansia pectinata]